MNTEANHLLFLEQQSLSLKKQQTNVKFRQHVNFQSSVMILISALLNGQTWFARPGAAGLLFQLTLGRHLSLQKKKKKKTIITQHAVTGVHKLLCVKAAAVTTL